MTEQFDEGYNDVMRRISLASIMAAAATFGIKAINKELEKSYASPIEVVQALKEAKPLVDTQPAIAAIDQAIQQYKAPKSIEQQQVKASPDENIIARAKPYITQHEIFGTDISDPINIKALSVNPDDAKISNPTIGIGHKWLPGDPTTVTPEQALKMFDKDIRRKYADIKRMFAPVWDTLSDDRKIMLLDAHFRGEIKMSYKWPKYVNSGQFTKAAKEYLNTKELRGRKKEKPGSGVEKRNNTNALILAGKAKINKLPSSKA